MVSYDESTMQKYASRSVIYYFFPNAWILKALSFTIYLGLDFSRSPLHRKHHCEATLQNTFITTASDSHCHCFDYYEMKITSTEQKLDQLSWTNFSVNRFWCMLALAFWSTNNYSKIYYISHILLHMILVFRIR